MVYDMATASSRAESSHNHRGTSQLHAIGESKHSSLECMGVAGWPQGLDHVPPSESSHCNTVTNYLNKSVNFMLKM